MNSQDLTPQLRTLLNRIERLVKLSITVLAVLVLCCRDRLTLGLLASGVLYELSYFPVGPNPDYRYSHWMIAATTLACVILFVRRLRAT